MLINILNNTQHRVIVGVCTTQTDGPLVTIQTPHVLQTFRTKTNLSLDIWSKSLRLVSRLRCTNVPRLICLALLTPQNFISISSMIASSKLLPLSLKVKTTAWSFLLTVRVLCLTFLELLWNRLVSSRCSVKWSKYPTEFMGLPIWDSPETTTPR